VLGVTALYLRADLMRLAHELPHKAGCRRPPVHRRADDDGVRLDRWFKRHLPQVGFGTVSRWARTGQIRVDGKRVKPEDRLAAGQVLRVPPGGDDPRQGSAKAKRELTADRSPRPKHADRRSTEARWCSTSRRASPRRAAPDHQPRRRPARRLRRRGEPRPRLVHRLDKDTSGVLLVAAPRAARRSSPSAFPGAAPRRSTGRWWSACPM
jgi:23S rRNA pseudouridine955/2504/2580 synthase